MHSNLYLYLRDSVVRSIIRSSVQQKKLKNADPHVLQHLGNLGNVDTLHVLQHLGNADPLHVLQAFQSAEGSKATLSPPHELDVRAQSAPNV